MAPEHNYEDGLYGLGPTDTTSGTDFTRRLSTELQLHIHSYIDFKDLLSMRLINQQCSVIAAEYLFHTIKLRPEERTVSSIVALSKTAHLARLVKEVIWETGPTHDNPSTQDWTWDDVVRAREAANEPETEPVAEDDEPEQAISIDELERTLSEVFQSFTALKGAYIVVYAQFSTRKLMDYARVRSYEEETQVVRDGRRVGLASRVLLTSLAHAGRYLRHFGIIPTLDNCGRALDCDHIQSHFVSFQGITRPMLDQFTRPLQRLESLRLRLWASPRRFEESVLRCEEVSLKDFLNCLSSLEDLDIAFEVPFEQECAILNLPLAFLFGVTFVYRYLRKLTLRCFLLDPRDLCFFLSRHADSLREVDLVCINLDLDETVGMRPRSRAVQLVLPDRTFHETAEDGPVLDKGHLDVQHFHFNGSDWDPQQDGPDTDDRDALKEQTALESEGAVESSGKNALEDDRPPLSVVEWEMVADTCKQLFSLEGVRFHRPSAGYRAIPPILRLGLEKRAMDGRRNIFDREWVS